MIQLRIEANPSVLGVKVFAPKLLLNRVPQAKVEHVYLQVIRSTTFHR